uniref:Putative LAGLIDADG 1 endonuclease n=1 Tax=Magnusiomyces magnusii TaxID=43963 RepID=K9L3G4_MAGMU|nr:putative LAGLIDADG 1 endonuclease [Magnusiomyces magnusii]
MTDSNHIEIVLPSLGTISPSAIKNKIAKKELKKNSLNIPKGFLETFVGFVDGDGYFSIGETNKGYIRIKLVINVSKKDSNLLKEFQETLKMGSLLDYKSKDREYSRYIINKTDLQYILIPLLRHHNLYFLTNNRRAQYLKVQHIMEGNIMFFKDIPEIEIPQWDLKDYQKVEFLRNWLVGFTMANGSFFIKGNKDACYQISQMHHNLLLAIKGLLNFGINPTPGDYSNLGLVSSIKDIQKVIDFFSFSGNWPIFGHKQQQYAIWIASLRESKRYKHLRFPNI